MFRVASAAVAVASAFLSLLAAAQAVPATPAYYLVCEIDRDDAITILSAEEVVLAGELHAEEPGASSTAREERSRIDVELFDGGSSVFRTTVGIDRYLRAEFEGAEGTIDGRWIERERTAFVVRIPRTGDALELTPHASGRSKRFPVAALPRRAAAAGMVLPASSLANGSASNRLDILVIGDGYTSAQSALFQTHANSVIGDFFSIPPYSTYQNYVNVTNYFVPSPQSGADHPNCADGEPDPLEGTFVNTAFDATFCSFGIQRLLTVDDGKVYTAAAAVPDWDKIIVIVNDPMYGGAGGGVSVVSMHDAAVSVAQHEFGHSFSGLADEYSSAYPGFPSCSDSGGPLCEPNVTTVTTRASVKWNSWISPSTPVPTTPQTSYTGVPGLFEGARYQTSGYYRPRYNCQMNALGVPFCEVCAQTYILRLYNGWGGTPSAGIDPIEPGSESPAPGAVSMTFGDSKTFSATILQPSGGPAATKQWYLDGVLQGSTGTSFAWTPASSGSHTVELRVKDATSLVKPAMAGLSLDSSRTWNVNVTPLAAPAVFTAYGNTASVSLSWSAVAGAASYEIARSTGGGFSTIATISGTAMDDFAVVGNTGYVYKVRAVNGTYSAPDLATVFTAADDPLAAGVIAKAVHLTQLRTAIDAARSATGLGPATYSFVPAGGELVRAADLQEMRAAANAARLAIGMASAPFTDPTLVANSTVILTTHVTELRNAIR